MIYKIIPVAKPRMTQRDRWAKRPIVERYWAYKDEVRKERVDVPECNSHITFHMPMPKSWSVKKKREQEGKAHQVRPDKDNLEKALLDAIYDEDSHIWDSRVTKVWAYNGAIEVTMML